jgi:hypothetical protein
LDLAAFGYRSLWDEASISLSFDSGVREIPGRTYEWLTKVREQIILISASQDFILSGNPAGFLTGRVRQARSSSVFIPEAGALHDF